MRKSTRFSAIMSLVTGTLMIAAVHFGGTAGCGGGAVRGGGGGGGGGEASGGFVDENGDAITSVDTNDPVNLSVTGLSANTQYSISVAAPDGTSLSPSGGFLATTDEDGNIPNQTVVQDLSTTGGASLVLRSQGFVPRIKAQTGTYVICVNDSDGGEVLCNNLTVEDRAKVFCSDSSGTANGSFTPAENVYATIQEGSGTVADGTYTCYVSSDSSTQLVDQSTLVGTQASVIVAGGVGTGLLGTGATFGSSGAYDVVCDLDADGLYDKGSDLISRAKRFNACFTVQSANSGGDIIGQICSDRFGNYRDIFDPDATEDAIRDVWAWIAPSERSSVQHAIGVCKFVVAHQTTWSDGDTLDDVTDCEGQGGYERDPVQGYCTNESPWLVWPRQCLTAGCYDCVIDIGCDGIYNRGTDFVDNIFNSNDNSLGGMCVSDPACSGLITISSPSDGSTVTESTTTLSGSVSDTTVTDGTATVSKQGSSNTVNLTLDGSGNFSSTIPLFNGENVITVKFKKTDGTFCSKTITVTADFSTASDELIHITATWNADTDMDLHFVKPSGDYLNQGGSSATDCNYGNCTGTGADWGTTGDDSDNPVLDIDDCVGGSCSNGRTENIVMAKVNEAGAYTVYMDAFADQAATPVNVTVTVFIRGSQVGQVSCPGQRKGTATDSCFVGTINWTGTGTSGNGTFTASGTLASDF